MWPAFGEHAREGGAGTPDGAQVGHVTSATRRKSSGGMSMAVEKMVAMGLFTQMLMPPQACMTWSATAST